MFISNEQLYILYKSFTNILEVLYIVQEFKKTGLMHSQQKNLENNLMVNYSWLVVNVIQKFFFVCLTIT